MTIGKSSGSKDSDFVIIGNGVLTKYTGSGGDVVIPEGVTSIGEEAFKDCESLTGIVIPGSVTSIGESAFKYCESLTGIVIPASVTNIGESAFSSCKSLTSITIPDSVTNIDGSAFADCKNLTSVTIPRRLEPAFEKYEFIKEIRYTENERKGFWQKLFG